ncbi:MAG: hypothetical protein WCO31_03955 [Actinomycetes bacterium]
MLKILVVCRANLCRSPVAARLLADSLGKLATPAEVRSRGLMDSGLEPPERYVEIVSDWGMDLEGHISQRLSPEDLAEADLVFTMTREILREVVVATASVWPKAFTMCEFVRRASSSRMRRADEDLETWLLELGEGRERRDLLGSSPDDDVADPVELSTVEDIVEVLNQLRQLSGDLASVLSGSPIARSSSFD